MAGEPQVNEHSGRRKTLPGVLVGGGVVAIIGILAVIGWGVFSLIGEQKRQAEETRQRQLAAEQEAARKAEDDMALAREAAAVAAKEKADKEAWHNQKFVSQIAVQIREAASGLDSPLVESFRGYQLKAVPAYWEKESTAVGGVTSPADAKWSGQLAHGTPIQISEHTYALIESHKGISFSLWHIDTQAGTLRKVRSYNDGPAADAGHQFEDVVWHKSDGKIIGEFVLLFITSESKNSHAGNVIIGELDAESGVIETKRDKRKFKPTKEKLKEALFAERRDDKTVFTPPSQADSLAQIDKQLASRQLKFDAATGQIHVSPMAISQVADDASAVDLQSPDAREAVKALAEKASQLPASASSRELIACLQLADASLSNDTNKLTVYLQLEDRANLRSLAAYQCLHVMAVQDDTIASYKKYWNADRVTPARDAALLRMHELGFYGACKIATVDAMDAFVAWAPNAMQAPDARKLAVQLEEERVKFVVEHARDKDAATEKVARELAAEWRLNRKKKLVSAAERCYEILTTHPDLKATQVALDTSDKKELDEFHDEVRAFQRQHLSALASIREAQSEQMDIIRNQLSAMEQTNRNLNYVGGQIANLREDVGGFESMVNSQMTSLRQDVKGLQRDK